MPQNPAVGSNGKLLLVGADAADHPALGVHRLQPGRNITDNIAVLVINGLSFHCFVKLQRPGAGNHFTGGGNDVARGTQSADQLVFRIQNPAVEPQFTENGV